MTFQGDGSFDGSRVRKRTGGKGGIAVGGGLGAIALFFLSQALGVDLTGLLGQGATSGETETALTSCETADRANEDSECRYGWTLESLDVYWEDALEAQTGVAYTEPGAVSFTGATQSGCGSASSATGPFYCPADETVYVDVDFFAVLQDRFGSSGGPLAEEYVVAHEVGHHVQQITGAMSSADRTGTGPDSDSVRIELMADCLAGMWAGNASRTIDPETGEPFLEPITDAQLADALSAAEAVGDDRIQEASSGQVDPEAWTHGSSEQRQRWFMTGYEGGTFQQCNALEAAAL
ncbi:KPN_02809 family neutral zinc metallopeptidase [Sanguibacter suaedae]|uniref:Neutral zinc metallopeptidase n=1 Tax=Sanguibacter suaedae TaxID=2795737 RepID=A0A934I3P2_9MICO|nr:neutral zinc metallopeptidase [Sanguibacter suaedae]MBI9115009.1 neutral zinc metallopeptidase [Sanguibacter suaedae]